MASIGGFLLTPYANTPSIGSLYRNVFIFLSPRFPWPALASLGTFGIPCVFYRHSRFPRSNRRAVQTKLVPSVHWPNHRVWRDCAMCVSVAWHCNERFTHRQERRGGVGTDREEGREGEIEREGRGGAGRDRGGKGERTRSRERSGAGRDRGEGKEGEAEGGVGWREGEINERERQVQTEEVGSSSVVVPMATWGVALQASLSFS